MNFKPLISVFIPVFNGEDYLVKTLGSVINQTYDNFELLIVDDQSQDNSLSICQEFQNRDSRIKVFSKSNGGNTAISWNFVLPKTKGDFVFYLSQDDLLSIDLFEKCIARQLLTNADCVLPELEFYKENKVGKKLIGLNGNKNEILSGKEAFFQSLEWNIHGFGLYKSSLFNNEIYPEDVFDSDEYMTRKLFLKSEKIAFCDSVFYYRQDNPSAITKTFSEKNFYRLKTFKRIYNLILEHNFSIEIQKDFLNKLNHYFLEFSCKFNQFQFESKEQEKRVFNFLSDFKIQLKELNNDIKTKIVFAKNIKFYLISEIIKNQIFTKLFCFYKQL